MSLPKERPFGRVHDILMTPPHDALLIQSVNAYRGKFTKEFGGDAPLEDCTDARLLEILDVLRYSIGTLQELRDLAVYNVHTRAGINEVESDEDL